MERKIDSSPVLVILYDGLILPREHLSACLEANGLYRGYFKLQAAIEWNVTARGF